MKPPSNRFPRRRVRCVIISAVIVLPVVVVVPVVLVVVPPAIIIKGGEISFTSRSACVGRRVDGVKEGAVKRDSARPKTVIIVVPVVLIVIPPAVVVERREVALRSRAAIMTICPKVAKARRPSVIAIVIVRPLARVRALDGRRVWISSPAVGAISTLLANRS